MSSAGGSVARAPSPVRRLTSPLRRWVSVSFGFTP